MAGDWLKVEASTPDKPEVFEIAMQVGIKPEEAFGRLFLVWRWFDQHTEDGNAANVSYAYLDRISGVEGFAEAMQAVGWLHLESEGALGCHLPNFDRHNGKTAKTRGLTAKRVATHKLRNANAALTQTALPREEKRRSKDTAREEYPESFIAFWSAYPKKVAKPDAFKAWKSLSLQNGAVQKVLAHVTASAASSSWQAENGRYVPYPATYLRDKRFEDETPIAAPSKQGLAL